MRGTRVTSTTIARQNLEAIPESLDRQLRLGVDAMSRRIAKVPIAYRSWRYDVTRSAKKQRPFGKYPEYALAVLRFGAPVSDALRPLDELRGWLLSHVPALRCLATALENETKEEGEANTAQMRLQRHADSPTPALLDEWITEAEQHKVALEEALRCAYALKYQGKRDAAR